MTYEVTMFNTSEILVSVEAENPDEAAKKALKGIGTLIHHKGGENIVVAVEENDAAH